MSRHSPRVAPDLVNANKLLNEKLEFPGSAKLVFRLGLTDADHIDFYYDSDKIKPQKLELVVRGFCEQLGLGKGLQLVSKPGLHTQYVESGLAEKLKVGGSVEGSARLVMIPKNPPVLQYDPEKVGPTLAHGLAQWCTEQLNPRPGESKEPDKSDRKVEKVDVAAKSTKGLHAQYLMSNVVQDLNVTLDKELENPPRVGSARLALDTLAKDGTPGAVKLQYDYSYMNVSEAQEIAKDFGARLDKAIAKEFGAHLDKKIAEEFGEDLDGAIAKQFGVRLGEKVVHIQSEGLFRREEQLRQRREAETAIDSGRKGF